jgi:D-beta-D-heptose 7-phosphate kinase/D-beta-D-heptose 1-phosphate adenosyltransferase
MVTEAKLLTPAELPGWVSAQRERGRRIVFTNGVFDLLHVGHVRYLQQAHDLGDVLVVGLNSDVSTRQVKGAQRPLVPEGERAEVLAALACVDAITIFAEPVASGLVALIQPDVYVKGGDYAGEQAGATLLTIMPTDLRRLAQGTPTDPSIPPQLFARLPEAQAVAEYGGTICLIPYLPEHSTTALIDRIIDRFR